MAQAHRVEADGLDPRRTKTGNPEQPVVKDTKILENGEQKLRVLFKEASHIGKRKKEQQDAFGHLEISADPALGRPACYVFIVADGVSMGEAGALASSTATEVFLKEFLHRLSLPNIDLSEAFTSAFSAANFEVFKLALTRPGMATTCAAALITGNTLVTAHVGDSRIYLARAGQPLKLITTDHSWLTEVGEPLARQGLLNFAELPHDARRHTITRAFGLTEKIQGDFNSLAVEAGDLVLLCTDGIWDVLPEGSLEEIQAGEDLEKLTQRLVEKTLEAGGRDNLTLSFAQVQSTGPTVKMAALGKLLERTALEVAERTNPELANSNAGALANRPFQPAVKNVTTTPEPEEIPNPKTPQVNLDMLISKAKRSFSLGDWDEAIDIFIEIEKIQASYQGLFETFSNSLIRYIAIAIGENRADTADNLIKKLESQRITRYHELLADYCVSESRQAAKANHHLASKGYAEFCLRLRPNEISARTLLDLNDLYLALIKPRTSLSERLALAQKIYARDEDFGSIQNDLAQVYMEMGDDAVKTNAYEDAIGWFSMIIALKKADNRLLSLASNKLHSIEDDMARKGLQPVNPVGSNNPSLTRTASAAALRALERERAMTDGKPEHELTNRLKERVSRAQKAWDGGRKEVGSEYIYLVDQLNELLSPNPWQLTLPRVCYDYGKWLLEQKQHEEARPYFVKAQQLGIAAAQQRISQIDRELRERESRRKGNSPNDLPEALTDKRAPLIGSPTFELPSEKPGTKGVLSHKAGLFTTRRPASIPSQESETEKKPLVAPAPPPPVNTKFVGASARIPDNVPPPAPATKQEGLPPRAAAAVAAGNWTLPIDEVDENNQEFSEELAGQAPVGISGTLRYPTNTPQGGRMHQAAKREVGRIAGLGNPQGANPRLAFFRRFEGLLSAFVGVIIPGIIIGIVVLGVIISLMLIIPNLKSDAKTNPTQIAAVTTAATGEDATATTAPVPTGAQGIVRIEGSKPEKVRVFLATLGDPTSPYRELELEENYFRLPVSTLNRLDPRSKYIVVVRPKDSDILKYAENLIPTSAEQQLLVSKELTVDPAKGFAATIKVMPEVLGFYPLNFGTTDRDIPASARYFAATRHSLRGEIQKYYNANGGLLRFGYPISEEFEWNGVGLVQFFERGWLSFENNKVNLGRVGKAILDNSCANVPRVPPSLTPVALPTIKPDPDFAATATAQKLGAPQSQVFEQSDKTRMQYFEYGRLELSATDKEKKVPPSLGLTGAEYARCIGWLK